MSVATRLHHHSSIRSRSRKNKKKNKGSSWSIFVVLFLGNATFLAVAMFWYAIYHTPKAFAPPRMIERGKSLKKMKLEKETKLRELRAASETVVEHNDTSSTSRTVNEEEHKERTQQHDTNNGAEEKPKEWQKEVNENRTTYDFRTRIPNKEEPITTEHVDKSTQTMDTAKLSKDLERNSSKEEEELRSSLQDAEVIADEHLDQPANITTNTTALLANFTTGPERNDPEKGFGSPKQEPTPLEFVQAVMQTVEQKALANPYPLNRSCSEYKGLLHISSGDQGAAAGTLFFQYMINQLQYAELHNLMPWIHLDNTTVNVYDDTIHSEGNTTIRAAHYPVSITWEGTPFHCNSCGAWPSPPVLKYGKNYGRVHDTLFSGTGVWNHYFQPVSKYDPSDPVCMKLPYISLPYEFLNPGIQFFSPWAVRSWEYQYMPKYLLHDKTNDGTLRGWFEPQRVRAHGFVQRYFRFSPHIQEAAERLVPDGTQCLAVHIRHSDKAGLARRKLPEGDFLPYVDAYLNNGGDRVYVATDSSRVLGYIRRRWKHVVPHLIGQAGIVRSSKRTPVFRIASHNQTNTEVLIDILALSRCQFMIHGYSAVSESAHYLNLKLHNQSVDLEDPAHMSETEFGQLVERLTAVSKS